MLEQAWATLAAAGGTAVVRAAGTDAWVGLRQAVAVWFARGDVERERAERERLDRTAAELAATGREGAVRGEATRIRQEAAWQARFEELLERLDPAERVRAAEELRTLLGGGVPIGRPRTPVPLQG